MELFEGPYIKKLPVVTNQRESERSASVLAKKQFDLKHLLIFSYATSLLVVAAYFVAPYFVGLLQITLIGICVISIFVGSFGMLLSLIISIAVTVFSRKPEIEKRNDQKLVMKMLATFLAIAIVPTIVAMSVISVLAILLGA